MRNMENLGHYVYSCGKIGRLMVMDYTPVKPGDGYNLNLTGQLSLSKFKRGLALDPVVDMCTFYVPHRYVYGDDWKDFMEQGMDETVSLPSDTVNAFHHQYLGHRAQAGTTVPKWLFEGYRSIWNRYYRPPTSVSEVTSQDTTFEGTKWGLKCAHLRRAWNTGIVSTLTASDYEVDTPGDKLNLYDLARQKAFLSTEIERDWYNTRYADVIKELGGRTETGADERPKLLYRATFNASGYDVDGTGSSSHGDVVGSVQQPFSYNVPRWMVPEHGTIWNVALVRFPPIHENERHYLARIANPTYKAAAGDPEILADEPPMDLKIQDVFEDTSTATLGSVPYGFW